MLKDQAECAAVQADFVYTDLTQSNSQVLLNLQSGQVIVITEAGLGNEGPDALQGVKELQREIVSKSCELSATHLDLHCWKQKAAVQRLRLVSVQEDLSHQKVHTEALSAECSRRQEQCNVAQAQLQAAFAQNDQLKSQLSQSAAAMADAQVDLLPQGLIMLSNAMIQHMSCSRAASANKSDCYFAHRLNMQHCKLLCKTRRAHCKHYRPGCKKLRAS